MPSPAKPKPDAHDSNLDRGLQSGHPIGASSDPSRLTLAIYMKDSPDSSKPPRVIVVVHGAGKKTPGWTDRLNLLMRWGPAEHLFEANFNQEASALASYINFAYRTDVWIGSLREDLEQLGAHHPGSHIDIVSHSWGSVVATALLGGGSVLGRDYDPITQSSLGSSNCRHLVTMGNPLCLRIGQMAGVHLNRGRPSILTGRWLNMHNRRDRFPYLRLPIGNQPLVIDGCENLELHPLTGHTGYWKSKEVADHIRSLGT